MYQSLRFGSIIEQEVRIPRKNRHVGCCERVWHYINENYMKPLFGKKEKIDRKGMYDSVRLTVLQSVVHGGPAGDHASNKGSIAGEPSVVPVTPVKVINDSIKPQ